MISIIIPLYNAEHSLQKCIDSALRQTYHNIEVILVNDGATDNSQHICEEFAQNDNRIKIIQQKNSGVSSARNNGMEYATGEYIMFLDSDDTLAPNACELLYNTIIEKNADCVICGTIEPNGFHWAPIKNKDYNSLIEFKKDFTYWLNTELLSPVWNKIYKKRKIKDIFCNKMSFGEDLCFSLDYIKNCEQISFITDAPHFHDNANNSSLTHNFKTTRFKDIERIQTKILEFAGTDTDELIYQKYVYDCINYMYQVCSTSAINNKKKIEILKKWYKNSYLKSINFAKYKMKYTERIMLLLWKINKSKFYIQLLELKKKICH